MQGCWKCTGNNGKDENVKRKCRTIRLWSRKGNLRQQGVLKGSTIRIMSVNRCYGKSFSWGSKVRCSSGPMFPRAIFWHWLGASGGRRATLWLNIAHLLMRLTTSNTIQLVRVPVSHVQTIWGCCSMWVRGWDNLLLPLMRTRSQHIGLCIIYCDISYADCLWRSDRDICVPSSCAVCVVLYHDSDFS